MPSTPQDLPAFAIFFGATHIVASLFSFADGDYLHDHGTSFAKAALVCAAATAALFIFLPLKVGFAIFAVTTVFHTVGQQLGLSRMMLGIKPRPYNLWKWTGQASAAFLILAIVLSDGNLESTIGNWCLQFSTACCVLHLVLLFFIVNKAPLSTPVIYTCASSSLLLASIGFYMLGHEFLAILVSRLVHDITAFMIYINHDFNRRKKSNSNWIYKLSPSHLIPFLIPSLAIVITWLINSPAFLWLLVFISFLHYLLESQVWKQGSWHRQNLQIRR